MTEVTCASCDKKFRPEDTAPYSRALDGQMLSEACRKCIGEWNKLGIFSVPFWKLKVIANGG